MDLNRRVAYNVLFEIEKNGAYSNIELNKQIEGNKPDSPAFVRELVYGVLENQVYIDYVLSKLIVKGMKGIKKQPLVLLRMGIYQLAFMNSVPEYAAVNETVALARKVARGREGFVNGVLRGYIKNARDIALPEKSDNVADYLAVKYSFDLWIVNIWIKEFGEEKAEAIMKASNETPKLCIRVNRTKTDILTLKKELENAGFDVRAGKLSDRVLFVSGSGILDTRQYTEGHFTVQDESSVVAVETLGPVAGEKVIDMCAAPGGKTLAMAELMENKGHIKAFDIYDHKLELIENDSERLSLSIIETAQGDGTVYNEHLKDWADKVLVDGPCSGLGVIRRKPEIKYRKLADNGNSLAEKQLAILENACRYVKKGGSLVYSTCTINRIENEDVVESFLKIHPEFTVVFSKQFIPGEDETDGFYICKFERL